MTKLWEKVLKELNPKSSQFKVLIYLAFEGPAGPSQIAEETGISPGTIRPALRALLSKKYVTQERDRTYKSKVPLTDIVSDIFTNMIRRN